MSTTITVVLRIWMWVWIGPGQPHKRTLLIVREEFGQDRDLSWIKDWARQEVIEFRQRNTHIHCSDVYGSLSMDETINP